jgi:2,4-dienoyl-CoA reductase-like NADH-dependent reductase (Old Yellow Enzyme family)
MKALFTPLQLRGLELKNRIVVSPMQQYSAINGLPGNWHLVHLGSRAVGGAGLIITECTAVSPDGMNTLSDTGLWNEEQVAAWKPIVKFVQEQGAKIAVQLWHAGGKGSHSHPNDGFTRLPVEEGGWITKSASATKMGDQIPEVLALDEIQQIKTDFVAAAQRAVAAGFDTTELHAGHGYLFHQFYSAAINKRTDEYGGSFDNRVRLLVDTAQEIRKVIPEQMPLLVRLSAVDYLESSEAWSIEDSVRLSHLLKKVGVDLITASGGGFAQVDKSRVFSSYQVPFATHIKKETGILTGAVGMITEAQQGNGIIENGEADLVVIAREHLRDPYFALHAAKALGVDVDVPWQYKRGV